MRSGLNVLKGKNFTAANFGKIEEFGELSFVFDGKEIKGKGFTKDIVDSTGTEISFSTLPPKGESLFFHTHIKNEETYIILKGNGYFQVDEECFEIKEGSVIRVAPKGKRGLYNNSDKPLIYMVVQSKANSLEEYTFTDGVSVKCKPKWR